MATADVYATRADVYKYGLARGFIANSARLCASVLAATDVFELDDHGLSLNDEIVMRPESGGNLPAPLVAGVSYFAIPQNDQTFKVAAVKDGAPIDLTTDGASVVIGTPLPYDAVLEFWSRFVDGYLPAHFVPLVAPYPPIIVGIVAKLAAKDLSIIAGQTSQSMTEEKLDAKAQVERWGESKSIRDARATHAADVAVTDDGSFIDPRGWGSGTVLL